MRIDFETWESFSYAEQLIASPKPPGYTFHTDMMQSGLQYPLLYARVWSNETSTLGTAENPSVLKYVLNHAMAEGMIMSMIIVSPIHNNANLNGQDGDSFLWRYS